MPTFPAPQPLPVVVDVPFAQLHVVAGDRDDVVVPAVSYSQLRAHETSAQGGWRGLRE